MHRRQSPRVTASPTSARARLTARLARLRPALVAGGLATALLVALPLAPAGASGSRDLYPVPAADCGPGGACRASLEWRTSSYGPQAAGETDIPRRTLLSVYAEAGETLLLGSSSLLTGAADAVVWQPGVVTDTQASALPAPSWSCAASAPGTGQILDRAQELAGPRSVDGTANPGGFVPCVYPVTQTGVYRVAFYGTAGGASNAQLQPDPAIDPTSTDSWRVAGSTSVQAWDVTVRGADPADVEARTGRVFTDALVGFAGNNPRPTPLTVYMTTLDGYLYSVDTRDFDPNGFVLYGNRSGFLDADGRPLNHDVVAQDGPGQVPAQLTSLVGGTHLAPPEFPLSFEPLAPQTLAALGIPATPVAPGISALAYTGRLTPTGSLIGTGGTFSFTTTTPGTYELVISRDGTSFDAGEPTNATILGVVDAAGAVTVTWDGLDNAGDAFPVGTGYPVRAVLRGGENHAPMLDVESSLNGGPSLTLLNPPGGVCPETSNGDGCTTAYYDDRGYVTSTGVEVGVPGGPLCSRFVGRVPDPLEALAGFDSTGTQRAFGDAAGTNRNRQCPATGGTLGDAKGLDLWTYYPSRAVLTAVDVLPPSDNPDEPGPSPTPTPTPTVTPSPTVTPTPGPDQPTPTATPGPSGSPTATPAPGSGGSGTPGRSTARGSRLALTGDDLAGPAVLGAGLLLAGAALVTIRRRRS